MFPPAAPVEVARLGAPAAVAPLGSVELAVVAVVVVAVVVARVVALARAGEGPGALGGAEATEVASGAVARPAAKPTPRVNAAATPAKSHDGLVLSSPTGVATGAELIGARAGAAVLDVAPTDISVRGRGLAAVVSLPSAGAASLAVSVLGGMRTVGMGCVCPSAMRSVSARPKRCVIASLERGSSPVAAAASLGRSSGSTGSRPVT